MSTSESSGTDDSVEAHVSSLARGRRSKVWEHFEQNLVDVDGELKAVCRYCQLKLGTKSGTSSLRSHIAEYCPSIEDPVRQRFILSKNKQPPGDLFVFDNEICYDRMLKFCIHAEIPFLKFEDPYLQPWIDSLQPVFKVPKRQTLRKKCFNKYEDMKKDLRNELQNLDSRVCLTSDMWTSTQNLGYMAITAHFINSDFKLKKKIISFREVKYPHTGNAIEEAIVSSLIDWGTRDKIFTLTLDNASNNTSACDELISNYKQDLLFEGEHLQVRCCAHILNLLVQDGMKIIHASINKIRELLKCIDSSPSRIQAFNEIANMMGLAPKSGISLDIPNRWNSTYDMLTEALTYRSVLSSYANQFLENCPTEEEWDRADGICKFLKAFEELTRVVSADRKPTAHKFLHVLLCIRKALKNPGWQTSEVLKELAAAMCVKFDKYWEPNEHCTEPNPKKKRKKDIEINLALIIATVLDPRRKGDYLDFYYEKVSTRDDQIDTRVQHVLEWMRKYFAEYEQLVNRIGSTQTSHPSQSSSTVAGSPIVGRKELDEEFEQYKSRRKGRAAKSELDTYLDEESEKDTGDFDVLAWWKGRAQKFPVLSAMARDFLAIPLSTVSSESAFSCGGRLLGDTRSSLAPEMLEALVCAKDWLFIAKDGDEARVNHEAP
ncbi:hypothetical protein ACP4OV_025211 [Aristida adscensionis]